MMMRPVIGCTLQTQLTIPMMPLSTVPTRSEMQQQQLSSQVILAEITE
jgi:hypothetical protein